MRWCATIKPFVTPRISHLKAESHWLYLATTFLFIYNLIFTWDSLKIIPSVRNTHQHNQHIRTMHKFNFFIISIHKYNPKQISICVWAFILSHQLLCFKCGYNNNNNNNNKNKILDSKYRVLGTHSNISNMLKPHRNLVIINIH